MAINWPTVQAYLKSQALALWGIVVAVVTVGFTLGPANGGFSAQDPGTFVTFMSHAWFGIVLAELFGIGPYVHAREAGLTSTTVVQGPDAVSIPNALVNTSLIPPIGTTAPKKG